MTVEKPRLGGLAEVAQTVGLTKQAAARALKRPGAPDPYTVLDMGPVYDLDEIDAWKATRKTAPGPAARRRPEGSGGLADR